MKLLYGTTNKSKIAFMQRQVAELGIEILSLADVSAPALEIEENGSSPLDNAKIKAAAYFDALKIPLFSCDSGLYIDGLDDDRQPGVNVRGAGDYMSDEEAIAYYAALAGEMGGRMIARFRNAICLILGDGQVYEYMGDEIASEPFYIVREPHVKRNEGFPLDSLSVHIKSGEYYFDRNYADKYSDSDRRFAAFFRRVMMKENLRKYYDREAEFRDGSAKADWKIRARRDFCDLIKSEGKKTLIELGAGAGHDSLYFADCGLEAAAVDLSPEMVR
jgi:8-oxo-dGTP diphosphatase